MTSNPIGAVHEGRSFRLFQRDDLALLGVLLLAALLLGVSTLGSRPQQPLDFDLDSAADNGLAGLNLWLRALGYEVRHSGGLQFVLPAEADLLFVYPNQLSYTAAEAGALRHWVVRGGTLVLVGPQPQDVELARIFGVRVTPASYSASQEQTQPLVPEGQANYSLDWSMSDTVLDITEAPSAVSVLRTPSGAAMLAMQQVGRGIVWHAAPAAAWTNFGLREQDQGQLLPPILRSVPAGGIVVFDTFHQFGLSRMGEQIFTLQDWLYRTPAGWATLFAFVALACFVLLQGRRLGPPVATQAERRKREAAEYVEAMAALTRRARLGAGVALHQQRRLKRGLAQRRPLDPNLADSDFVARLAAGDPPLSVQQVDEVRQLLAALQQGPNEQQMVLLAAQIDTLLSRRTV